MAKRHKRVPEFSWLVSNIWCASFWVFVAVPAASRRFWPFLDSSEFQRLKFVLGSALVLFIWRFKTRMVTEIEMLGLMRTLLAFFAPSLMLVASSHSGTKSAIYLNLNTLLNKWIEATQSHTKFRTVVLLNNKKHSSGIFYEYFSFLSVYVVKIEILKAYMRQTIGFSATSFAYQNRIVLYRIERFGRSSKTSSVKI